MFKAFFVFLQKVLLNLESMSIKKYFYLLIMVLSLPAYSQKNEKQGMYAGQEDLAFENYKKADISKLDKDELNEFVRCSYLTGHFEEALQAAEAGINLDPRSPTFNRLAMFSNYELKNYETAKRYIYKYFYETDNPHFSEYDHLYASLIYRQLKDFKNSISHCEKALKLVNDSSMIKRWTVLKTASDIQIDVKNYESAIKYYQEYMDCKPNLSPNDYDRKAKLFTKYAEADENKKTEMYKKALNTYRQIGKRFNNQIVYSTYMCGTINSKIDIDGKKELAKADFKMVIDILTQKFELSPDEKVMLKYAYHYLMFNSYINNRAGEAKKYAVKILAIDPEYKPALDMMDL